jgi:hypothetical protein
MPETNAGMTMLCDFVSSVARAHVTNERPVRARANDSRRKETLMNLGLSAFTLFHVLLSLVGIVAGFVAMFGWIRRKPVERWTIVFLSTTTLTSVTGFLFPFTHFLPSHAVGIFSLLVLPIAVAGRYAYHLKGAWRWLYAVSSVTALYLNMFVLVVQLFLKVPALKALAPTQTEPPFLVAQLLNLGVLIWLGVAATLKSKAAALSVASQLEPL